MSIPRDNGWIKLWRVLCEHSLWLEEKFTRGQAWVDMLLMAAHSRAHVRIRGVKVSLNPGQLAVSEVQYAKRWQWSRGKVRRFLSELEQQDEPQIEQQKTNITTVVTILNWTEYQEDNTADRTASDTANGQQTDTYKNVKNVHNSNYDVDTKVSAGDSKESGKTEKRRTIKNPHPALKAWNADPNTRTHRMDSKISARIQTNLRALENGTFFDNHTLSQQWLKENGLRRDMVNCRWTPDGLRKATENLCLACRDDYTPRNADWIKKSDLNKLIYNPNSQKSFLVAFYYNPPKFLKDQAEEDQTAKLSKTARRIYDTLYRRMNTDGDIDSSHRSRTRLRRISEKFANIWDRNGGSMMLSECGYGKPEDMADDYCEAFHIAYKGLRDWDSRHLWGAKLKEALHSRMPQVMKLVEKEGQL